MNQGAGTLQGDITPSSIYDLTVRVIRLYVYPGSINSIYCIDKSKDTSYLRGDREGRASLFCVVLHGGHRWF